MAGSCAQQTCRNRQFLSAIFWRVLQHTQIVLPEICLPCTCPESPWPFARPIRLAFAAGLALTRLGPSWTRRRKGMDRSRAWLKQSRHAQPNRHPTTARIRKACLFPPTGYFSQQTAIYPEALAQSFSMLGYIVCFVQGGYAFTGRRFDTYAYKRNPRASPHITGSEPRADRDPICAHEQFCGQPRCPKKRPQEEPCSRAGESCVEPIASWEGSMPP